LRRRTSSSFSKSYAAFIAPRFGPISFAPPQPPFIAIDTHGSAKPPPRLGQAYLAAIRYGLYVLKSQSGAPESAKEAWARSCYRVAVENTYRPIGPTASHQLRITNHLSLLSAYCLLLSAYC
jgi:hypothetical protein